MADSRKQGRIDDVRSAERAPRRVFYILTPVLSVVLTLLFLEVFLRLFRPVPPVWETNMYFVADRYTGFRPKPNAKAQFGNIPAVTNSRGHRDKEISLPKKTEILRILALGDSFTVGTNVFQDEAYPEVLEKLLTQSCRTPVEVVNSGVGGWQPFHYAQYYQYYGRFLNPDLVLIGFFVGNDTYDQLADLEHSPTAVSGRRVSRKAATSLYGRVRLWLYEHSHLARLIEARGFGSSKLTRRDCKDLPERYIAVQTSRLPNHLKRDQQRVNLAKNAVSQILRIKKQADASHVPVIVVLLPDENQVNTELQKRVVKANEWSRYDFEMPQSLLIEMLEEIHVSLVINLLPDFRNDGQCRYMNDTHWTAGGHAIAAQVICERLKPFVDAHRAAGMAP